MNKHKLLLIEQGAARARTHFGLSDSGPEQPPLLTQEDEIALNHAVEQNPCPTDAQLDECMRELRKRNYSQEQLRSMAIDLARNDIDSLY